MRPLALVVILVSGLQGCGPAAIDGGFDSANPSAKLYAIEDAARRGDRTAIPRIVEQLHSDDPAVRSVAISALKRMTGQTYGYRDFDPPELRTEAIARWVQAIHSGELEVNGATAGNAVEPRSATDRGDESDHG